MEDEALKIDYPQGERDRGQLDSEDDRGANCGSSSSSGEGFDTIRKKAQGHRVYELEQQLQIAESRCGTLKQQVEYMRMLYAGVNQEGTEADRVMDEACDPILTGEPPERPEVNMTSPKVKTNVTHKTTASSKGREQRKAGVVSELKEHFERRGFKGKQMMLKPLFEGLSKSAEEIKKVKRLRTIATAGGQESVRSRRLRTGPQVPAGMRAGSRSEAASHRKMLPKRAPIRGNKLYMPGRADSDLETETGKFDIPGNALEKLKNAKLTDRNFFDQHWEETPTDSSAVQRCCTMNYQMPTVSSELKRVNARSFLRDFDFRSIPFVAGQSTAKSHNLGLRIQETLSLLKLKAPIGSIPLPGLEQNESLLPPSDIRIEDMSTALLYPTNRGDFQKMCEGMLSDGGQQHAQPPQPSVEPSEIGLGPEADPFGHMILEPHTQQIMKKVLSHLHDEFSDLAKDYEDAKRKFCSSKRSAETGNGDEASKAARLREMEHLLELRENEINAIILLYREVKNAKMELRRSKYRGSVSAFNYSVNRYGSMWPPTRKGYYNGTFKLMTFLHKLEDFQIKLKGTTP